jgi:ABC-type transport system involved in multi-copper enzyme maturation permease subunit
VTGGFKVSAVEASAGLYGVTHGLMAMLGMVSIIAAVILADGMINGAFKRKCEILHLSQPVSMLKVLGAKYALLVLGTFALSAALSLVNSFVLSGLLNIWMPVHTYYAMVAWAQGSVGMLLSLLVVASYYWLSAALFKRKSFFMGTLVILGIEIAIAVLNYTGKLGIPSLMDYIAKLIGIQVHIEPHGMNALGLNLDDLIALQWKSVISWLTLQKLVLSAVFVAGGYWFYSRRELT